MEWNWDNSHLTQHEKASLEMIKKFAVLKKGIGIENEKNYANKLGIKQDGNRLKIQIKGYYRMEINSKTFAIPILIAILSTINQMQSEQGQ